jgi:hypothetical protein
VTITENTIYDRIRAGEIVAVRTKQLRDVNGNLTPVHHFSIQYEKIRGFLHCYSALKNGRRVKGHNRMLLDVETARDWCSQLELDTSEE